MSQFDGNIPKYKEDTIAKAKAITEAMKGVGSQVANSTKTDTSTSASTPKVEEGFFAKNKTAIIVVGCFALAGTAYYFYSKKKK